GGGGNRRGGGAGGPAAMTATPRSGRGCDEATLRGRPHVYVGLDVLGPRRATGTRFPVGSPAGLGEDRQEDRRSPAQSRGAASRPERADATAGADAERACLRRIARTSLLPREAEIELGERIATAERTIAREALGSAPGVRYVLSLRERLESGQVRARDLVRIDSDDPGGEDAARRRLLAGLAR